MPYDGAGGPTNGLGSDDSGASDDVLFGEDEQDVARPHEDQESDFPFEPADSLEFGIPSRPHPVGEVPAVN